MRSGIKIAVAIACSAAAVAAIATGCSRPPAMQLPRGVSVRLVGSALECRDCNLLLISIDTLRADRLGSAGYERDTSPNLDRFARQGFVFTDVLAQAPTTAASHRSMFSGKYVFQHRNELNDTPVIATLLAKLGYTTAGFVDGGQLNRDFGLHRGFDVWRTTGGVHEAGAQVGGGLEVLNPQLIEWLGKHRDQPFFAFLHTYDVHCPYTPPEPYRSMFLEGEEPLLDVEGKCGISYFNKRDLGPDEHAYISALYDGGVRHVDHKLQEIFDALAQLNLEENTIVVVTSDHGESLGERGRVGHNRVYDVQLKVPLIVRMPRTKLRTGDPEKDWFAVGRSDIPAQSVDLLPTIMDVLGHHDMIPPDLAGHSLGRLLGTKPPTQLGEYRGVEPSPLQLERMRLAENAAKRRTTIRLDNRHTLLLRAGEPEELYDLHQDPTQEHNLLEAHPELAKPLFRAYRMSGSTGQQLLDIPAQLDPRTREQLKALGYIE